MRYLWFICLFILSSTISHAQASFDCSLAATPTENAICTHDDLSQLDRQMASAFRDARGAASQNQSDRILTEQRAWLGRRDACGSDRDCLSRVMRDRIDALTLPETTQSSGLTGLYCNDAAVMGLQEQGANLRFDFLFFSGGFSCGTGILTAQRSGAGWTSMSDGCRLNLTHEGGAMVVRTDTVAACQENYCGARAAITEFRMPLADKAPGISDPFIGGVGERPC